MPKPKRNSVHDSLRKKGRADSVRRERVEYSRLKWARNALGNDYRPPPFFAAERFADE
jgi:hypothetical protein